VMKKGLLPTLTFGSEAVSSDAMPLIMNLIGLDETLVNLTKDPSPMAKAALAEKVLETAARVASEKSGKNERLGIAAVEEEGASRLASLDFEKYGRAGLQTSGRQGYSLGPRLTPEDFQARDKIEYVKKLAAGLNGGLSVVLDATSADLRGTYNAINAASADLPYFRVHRVVSFCRNCGTKMGSESGRCKKCRSTAMTPYSTAD